jgi:hypothetical protein
MQHTLAIIPRLFSFPLARTAEFGLELLELVLDVAEPVPVAVVSEAW